VTQPTNQFRRRRTLLVVAFALAALAAFSIVAAGYATPNSAARAAAAQYNNKPTTGTKISIFGPPATFYMGDDPTCTANVVPAGSGFVDNGHDVHIVRNEGTVDLVTVVVSLVPMGFTRRIDEPAPGNCPF